jgi:hypothetical protein
MKAMPTTSGGYYDDGMSFEDGVKYLRELLDEFPFSDWRELSDGTKESRSQAVHLSAMFNQFAPLLISRDSGRMGFLYNSNSQRSGKSLLMKMAIIPVNGRMASQSWSRDEELKKTIDAESLRASRYLAFDNVRPHTHVASQVLEGFMTSASHTGRLLGYTQMFEAPNTATVFISGNDLTVSTDLKWRMLECSLFVEEADVQSRKVKEPIDESWLREMKNRRNILNALSAIIRAWADAGQPEAKDNIRLGYEPWCRVFGGLTKFSGFGDPLAPPEDFDGEQDIDTETANMRSLIMVLADPILSGDSKREEFNFQQIVNAAHNNELFDWLLDGKDVEQHEAGSLVRTDYVLKSDSKSKVGKLLKRYLPYAGELQGPRHRSFWFGQGDQRRQVKTSSMGQSGRRKFILELGK